MKSFIHYSKKTSLALCTLLATMGFVACKNQDKVQGPTDTTSSGVEVPTATTVSPMMNSGTRNRCANAAEPSVRKFAPARISPRPMMRSKMSKL